MALLAASDYLPSDIGAATILGCPISAFVSLNSKCPVTGSNLPTCATQTAAAFDAQCCGSISSFGNSLVSCYSSNAPKCLDLSALSKSITQFGATATDGASYSDPCAKFASAPTSGTGSSNTASQTGSGNAKTSGSGSGSASATGSAGAAATTSAKSAANSLRGKRAGGKEMGLGLGLGLRLKVYAGLALVASLGVWGL
ncbi:hypothetical protein ACMFMG_006230 [Clarireedia jacksonii]